MAGVRCEARLANVSVHTVLVIGGTAAKRKQWRREFLARTADEGVVFDFRDVTKPADVVGVRELQSASFVDLGEPRHASGEQRGELAEAFRRVFLAGISTERR